MMESRVIPWSVCYEWMERKMLPPLRHHFYKCERQDEMTLQEVIETFAPETGWACAEEGGAKSVSFKPDLSPPAPIWPFYECLKLLQWRQSLMLQCISEEYDGAQGSGWKGQRGWGTRSHDLYREAQSNSWAWVWTREEAVDMETQHGSFSMFLPWASPLPINASLRNVTRVTT